MKWVAGLLGCWVALSLFAADLPKVGTKFKTLPKGGGRTQVEAACLPCHSTDLLAQQRLTEKQWNAELDKMLKWGAVFKDTDRPKMLLYLVKNFGPENKFSATRAKP